MNALLAANLWRGSLACVESSTGRIRFVYFALTQNIRAAVLRMPLRADLRLLTGITLRVACYSLPT